MAHTRFWEQLSFSFEVCQSKMQSTACVSVQSARYVSWSRFKLNCLLISTWEVKSFRQGQCQRGRRKGAIAPLSFSCSIIYIDDNNTPAPTPSRQFCHNFFHDGWKNVSESPPPPPSPRTFSWLPWHRTILPQLTKHPEATTAFWHRRGRNWIGKHL